jgi:PAS domain S-box-containing protein
VKKSISPLFKPFLLGLVTFILILSITLLIANQQINLQQEKEKEELAHELHHVKDNFRNILYSDITAANSLSIFYKQYGVTNDFDSIAAQIIRYNKYAEALQLNINGVITKVYPIKGYEKTIGLNTGDSMRLQESKRAFQKNDIYFAGPRKLRQGGIGILGKVPIRKNQGSFAVSVVLTKLETIEKALHLDADSISKFSYWLKDKSAKSDTTTYFLSKERPFDISKAVYTDIPEGDWIFGSAYSIGYSPAKPPFVTLILGGLLAILSSVFIYRISSQPFKLKKIITEKTKELADQEKYYRTLIQTSTDAISLMDKTGKIIYQTLSVERIIGYTYEDMQQIDSFSLIHPDTSVRDKKAFNKFAQDLGSELKAIQQIKHKHGYYIWIEGTYLNLLHDETVHAIVLTYTDITQRKNMEDERQRLFEERLNIIDSLTHRNHDLEQFSFIVSHNIRAPLANILGLTNLLNDSRYGEDLKEKAIEGIQTSASNLDAILLDLNDILQVRNEPSQKKMLVSLSEKADKAKELLVDIIRSQEAVIETDFTQIDSFNTIKSYINNIFYSLISNSIKYAQPDVKPHVKIWSEKINDKIVLHFKDNGLGFNLERDGNSIFGLYKRFNLTTEGKGMGLFMIKKQVESLNGTIELMSKPNEGAHFIITFHID